MRAKPARAIGIAVAVLLLAVAALQSGTKPMQPEMEPVVHEVQVPEQAPVSVEPLPSREPATAPEPPEQPLAPPASAPGTQPPPDPPDLFAYYRESVWVETDIGQFHVIVHIPETRVFTVGESFPVNFHVINKTSHTDTHWQADVQITNQTPELVSTSNPNVRQSIQGAPGETVITTSTYTCIQPGRPAIGAKATFSDGHEGAEVVRPKCI